MQKAIQTYVAVGSNYRRKTMLAAAYQYLKNHFTCIYPSPVYRSKAVSFAGNDFYNVIIEFSTSKSLPNVNKILHEIEFYLDATAKADSKTCCKMDLDLLLYGDTVVSTVEYTLPRRDILQYAFVLKPLADIAPTTKHPQLAKTYKLLWDEFSSANTVDLQVVNFNW